MTHAHDDDARFMDLFETAVRLSPEVRRPHVLAACADNATLAEDVLARVAAHEQMGDFLLEPLVPRHDLDIRFAPGEWVSGRFRIVREVGEGGMGIVYEAIDAKLDQRCALKCAKSGFARRLPAEARNALRITHDNVCRVYGIYTVETPRGTADVLAMEYLDGETLSDRIARSGPVRIDEAAEIAHQVCAGLGAAHREGVLHRDLKSNNIMLTAASDGRCRAVVTDFGLARQHADDAPAGAAGASDGPGASSYTAPEILAGAAASIASDMYSLGVVLNEMVTGRLPDADAARGGHRAPGLDRRWDRCIRRCLAGNPSARPADAGAVAATLRPRRRTVWRWAAAALVAAAAGIAGFSTSTSPATAPIRLALLPLEVSGADPEAAALGGGVLVDLADRLQRLRPRGSFAVIPANESLKYGVTTAEQARTTLGATHALTGSLRRAGGSNGTVRLEASVIDGRTLVSAGDMSADYRASEFGEMPVALAGTITSALRLAAARFDAPIDAGAYSVFAQGMFHLRSGVNADLAIERLQKAADLDPRSALPHAALTEAFVTKYQRSGDAAWLARARESLTAAERRNPDLAPVQIASGLVHRITGNHDKAAEHFTRATELEPNNVVAWVGLARAYEAARTRPDDAAAAYQKAVDLQPDYYLPRLEFASFYHFLGNYDRAEHHLLHAVSIAPNLVSPFTNLGGLYADMGRYADAERMLRRSLELEESSGALTNLGAMLNYQGRDREALAFYRKALARDRPHYVLMVNIGDSCRRAGLAGEAAEAYGQGFDLADAEVLKDPRNGYARAFVAYFAARLGQPATARREIEQALRFSAGDGKVTRRAVLTFEALGQRERALAVLADAPPAVVQELSRQPDLTALRQDARFQQLLRRTGAQ